MALYAGGRLAADKGGAAVREVSAARGRHAQAGRMDASGVQRAAARTAHGCILTIARPCGEREGAVLRLAPSSPPAYALRHGGALSRAIPQGRKIQHRD